jgi:enoyl-CoA hydratase/carnithine racemase
MSYNKVKWSIEDGIGYLVLSQPPANAMTLDFFGEIDELTRKIKSIKGLKGIIIRGQGRHFSSGADLNELTDSINEKSKVNDNGKILQYPEFMRRNLTSLNFFFNDLKIPVIAAIKGVCIGSAFEFALFSHCRLCTSNAVLGLPESTYGLMPGLGGIQLLFEHVTKARAMEIVFRGATFNADEAMKTGVIDRIFPKDHLLVAAEKLVEIAGLNYRRYNKNEYLHQLDKALRSNE